ncbi:MAG: hypothetical protein EP319_16755 [Deltaproteobacteria bacterium]|nr:MAG: hypothetical protein EP319_16755 [Deltaproteobacteria bacterium]
MESENQNQDSHKEAYSHAIRLLARKDYSRHKMEKKLIEKGFDRALAKEVVSELIEKRFLREELYVESRVKGLIRKGWSYEKVIHHLEQEKCPIDSSMIDEIIGESGIDTDEILMHQIQKKWGSQLFGEELTFEQKQKKKEKVLRYLVSKGHHFSESKAALERFLSTH